MVGWIGRQINSMVWSSLLNCCAIESSHTGEKHLASNKRKRHRTYTHHPAQAPLKMLNAKLHGDTTAKVPIGIGIGSYTTTTLSAAHCNNYYSGVPSNHSK